MVKQLTPYMSEFRRQGIEEGREIGREQGLEQGLEQGIEQGIEQGRPQGHAEAILRVLDKRGVAVDDGSRQRITSCTDLDTLGTWLDRSLTAAQVSELFA